MRHRNTLTITNQTFDKSGRALDLSGYDDIIITNCTFTNTAGIFIQAKNYSLIRIQNNKATNIIRTKGMEYAQFVQISGLNGSDLPSPPIVVDCQITGNQIVNVKGVCDVEDVVNLIGITGTAKVPILVQGNTITGAYPLDCSPKSIAAYSGGGIMCDRGVSYASVVKNQVTETTNYGIGVAGGCNNSVEGNVVTAKDGYNVGIYCANMYAGDPFSGNVVTGNSVDWTTPKGRNDYWIP